MELGRATQGARGKSRETKSPKNKNAIPTGSRVGEPMSSQASDSLAELAAPASYEWVIGVLLCFMGSVLSNMGVNFQKKCHMVLADRAKAAAADAAATGRPLPGKKPRIVAQPLWVGGLIAIALGSARDLFSFGFAPLSLLAPLGAMVRPWATGGHRDFFGRGTRFCAPVLVVWYRAPWLHSAPRPVTPCSCCCRHWL